MRLLKNSTLQSEQMNMEENNLKINTSSSINDANDLVDKNYSDS